MMINHLFKNIHLFNDTCCVILKHKTITTKICICYPYLEFIFRVIYSNFDISPAELDIKRYNHETQSETS